LKRHYKNLHLEVSVKAVAYLYINPKFFKNNF